MYISTYTALGTALSGVEAAQEQLQVTGNNIANANTPGYSRQVVNLSQSPPLTTPLAASFYGSGVQIGTGVDATGIDRIRSQYLDSAYRNQNANTGATSTQQSYLNQIQSALGEPSSSGLGAQLAKFWSDWSSLANDPSSAAAKTAVVNDGSGLASSLGQLSQQLTTIQSQAGQQYGELTGPNGQVASYASQIAQLNTSIKQEQAGGMNPNALMDQRDQLIDKLSALAHTTATDNGDGTVTVNFGDAGSPLVSGSTANWPQTITSAAGGQLGTLLSLSQPGGQIAQYQSSLDAVAAQLASTVNSPTVNGATVATNPPFFTGTTSATLAVNPALTANPSLVQTTTTTNPGANDVALAIAGLAGGPADQSYQSLVTQIGADTQAAAGAATTQQALTTAIDNQRQSTSGVDLSQEMTNLVQEQQAYQASAKVMNTFQTMMGSLLAMVGS